MLASITAAILSSCAFLGASIALAGSANAHDKGTSLLRLSVEGTEISGEWELSLPDARKAVGLDPALLGDLGWLELRERESELRAYLSDKLALTLDGAACPIALTPTPMEWQSDLAQVQFHIAAAAAVEPTRLGLRCTLLFDLDPGHRAYFSIEDARAVNVGVFRTELRSIDIDVRNFHFASGALEFIREGVWHIWTGFDHLLFLLALLLPAALVRQSGAWSPRAGLWPTSREVLKVVTAFTLGHSLTLCLAFFGTVSLPSRWVEVGIAVSVFAAAWNNLRPFLPGRAWLMAAAFGLVHGLGFAGALGNLALPRQTRGLALAAFNIGVELGQIVIVAAILPLLYYASRRRWYPRFVMGTGSLAIAWLAVLWVLERGFALSLFAVR